MRACLVNLCFGLIPFLFSHRICVQVVTRYGFADNQQSFTYHAKPVVTDVNPPSLPYDTDVVVVRMPPVSTGQDVLYSHLSSLNSPLPHLYICARRAGGGQITIEGSNLGTDPRSGLGRLCWRLHLRRRDLGPERNNVGGGWEAPELV